MIAKRDLAGELRVDGEPYCWELRSEPHWVARDGWQGMHIAIRHRDGQHEAILCFPMPGARRSRLQPHLRRPRVDGAILANAVRSALAGGWEPMKRGKPIAFAVDASGLPDVNQAP